jgi:hypothetical protein
LTAEKGWYSDQTPLTIISEVESAFALELAGENYGKHKVPTLRNVARRLRQRFPKAYVHNGVFKTLAEVVKSYDERDSPIAAGLVVPGVLENMNTEELGDLGLTDEEEAGPGRFHGDPLRRFGSAREEVSPLLSVKKGQALWDKMHLPLFWAYPYCLPKLFIVLFCFTSDGGTGWHGTKLTPATLKRPRGKTWH